MITIETRCGKKAYETVAERVKKFRATYPVDSGWQLLTEIDFPKDDLVLCRAKILDPNGRLVATGTAEETRGSSVINKTSAVENAETSAIGRALFAAGFGGGEFCSADELMTAIQRQEELKSAESRVLKGARQTAGGSEEHPQATPPARAERPRPQPASAAPEEVAHISPGAFGLPEDCGIEFVQEESFLLARDRKKGATFSNKEVLKNAGFSFDGHQRLWFKKIPAEDAA